MNQINPVVEIKQRLQKYPNAKYELTQSSAKIFPADEQGFEVSLLGNIKGWTVSFEGWHEEFSDAEKALNVFAFGLCEDCRLTITVRGIFQEWMVEEKIDEEWHNCDWVGCNTTGLLVFPLWPRKKQIYKQNHLIRSEN